MNRRVLFSVFFSLVVLFGGLVCAQENNQKQQPAASEPNKTEQRAKEPLSITVVGPVALDREKEVETNWREPNCKAPKNHDEADLCQQTSMAQAAYWTVGIGVLTLFGLAFTIYYTRKAVRAAVSANETALEAVEVSRVIGKAQVRAYVAAMNVKAFLVIEGGSPKVTVAFRNTGQSPAIKVAARIGTRSGADAERVPIKFPDRPSKGQINQGGELNLECQTPDSISADQLDRLNSGDLQFVVGGFAVYRDVFGTTRRTVFRLVLDPKSIRSDGTARFKVCRRNNRSN
jgi:hypothetical protein